MTRPDLEALSATAWPSSRLCEALHALGRGSGLLRRGAGDPDAPAEVADTLDGQRLDRWVETVAHSMGLEAEPVQAPYPEALRLVSGAAPALLRLGGGHLDQADGPRFLALAKVSRGHATVLACPDLTTHRVPLETLRQALCFPLEQAHSEEIDGLLDRARVPPRRRGPARRALLGDRLGAAHVEGCFLLRQPPGASFRHQLLRQGLSGRVASFLGAHLTQYLLLMAAWWVVGRGALQGTLDHGWLLAWALLLLTVVPCSLLVLWSQGRIALGAGLLLKQRLLHGALQLPPDQIRHQGAGQLLGRVMESGAVEAMALNAGFAGLVALLELVLAGVVLALGAGGGLHVALLTGVVAGTLGLGWLTYRRTQRWTEARLGMTHDLVERMVGHRTRLAQEPRQQWHDGEDQALERYLELSRRLDQAEVWLSGLVQRGWMLLGLAGLAPAFVAGSSTTALAVGLGGVMLAAGALSKLASSLSDLSGTAVAWQQVAPLFHASAQAGPRRTSPAALAAVLAGPADERAPVLEAEQLVFRYRAQGPPVLRGCDLSIAAGDRLLLEGTSGGGKSTLASVITGLRRPEAGLLLAGGLDMQTLGPEGWRRRVVAAPQFHENHVMTGTLAFNLLMGRRWPATNEDLEQAEQLCHELGLGPLLERMPAGLSQVVGDTGWRLSHGEQSRLFMARALLQGADLVVLDESFAALDPESLDQALRCVLQRAPALVVIAHP